MLHTLRLALPFAVALSSITAFGTGCDGTLELQIASDDGMVVIDTSDPAFEGATGGSAQPGGGFGAGSTGTGDPDNPTPVTPELPPLLHNATVGTRCVEGETVEYLVLSDDPSDCTQDAGRIDAATTSGEVAAATVIALPAEAVFQRTVRYCPPGSACTDLTLDFTIDRQAGVTGTWSGVVNGERRTMEFAAGGCQYDAVVEPLPSDTPAAGISIDEVAVYQGVKIPIVEDGQMIAERNAPIVAGRPGVVRVFVTPQADWQERDIRARLTLGDIVKEETFRPAGLSTEEDGQSTINFALEADELLADVGYSVELFESESCADVPGELANPRVPAADTAELKSVALAQSMKIVLVPIQYQADGSNRLPNTSAAAIERFRNEAFTHYPVHDIEMTVREPVATSIGMAPNGAGFGEMLNLCLSIRANDNPAPDVFYYCMIQPASTLRNFCGGGCVAGVAPLAGTNDVQARGGIGITFENEGEGTFVHEIGHALGRPHAPCGGAAGTDPNYPYAQGLIGSWGYNIMNGNLFAPTQRADFMSYCNPTWVSDYTYGEIFDRLSNVLGTQTLMSNAQPKRWKTAVLQAGSALKWGPDVNLKHLPTGSRIPATLRDFAGNAMGSPEVYVTPVADIDAVLITVEDTGFSGATVEIPGLGEIIVE